MTNEEFLSRFEFHPSAYGDAYYTLDDIELSVDDYRRIEDALEKQIETEKTSCEKCKHYQSVRCALCGPNLFEPAEEKNE